MSSTTPVLIDRPPPPVSPALALEQQLVAVPLVARPRPPRAQPGREGRPERLAPLPHALAADDQATLGEQVLDIAQAEVEPVVQPDGVADDLGWEAAAMKQGPVGRRGEGW